MKVLKNCRFGMHRKLLIASVSGKLMIGKIVRESGSLVLLVMPVWVAFSLLNRLRTRRPDAGDAPGDTFWWFGTYVILLALLTLAPPPISRSNGHFRKQSCAAALFGQMLRSEPGPAVHHGFLSRINHWQPCPLRSARIPASAHFRRNGVGWVNRRRGHGGFCFDRASTYAGRFVGNPRWSDVDDVIFNVLGAVVGYALLRLVQATRISTRFDSN